MEDPQILELIALVSKQFCVLVQNIKSKQNQDSSVQRRMNNRDIFVLQVVPRF